MEALASDVSGATPGLVERVLEEYGDPVDDDPSMTETASSTSDDQLDTPSENDETESKEDQELSAPPDPAKVSKKQWGVLQAIYENPDATQRDLAERFDVTAATISRRVNAIDGFEWGSREKYANQIFDNGNTEPMMQDHTDTAVEDHGSRLDDLEQQVHRLETQVNDSTSQFSSDDSELVAKVMHACLHSDQITEDEEVQILTEFLS